MTDFDRYGLSTFTLTEDHLKLMRRTYVDHADYGYDGGFAQNMKRPYGNSDVIGDLYELLVDPEGWSYEDHDDEDLEKADPELAEKLLRTHRELDTAVQVVLATQSFEVGDYKTTRMYDRTSWEKVD